MVLEEHELGEGTIETTVMNGIPTSLRGRYLSYRTLVGLSHDSATLSQIHKTISALKLTEHERGIRIFLCQCLINSQLHCHTIIDWDSALLITFSVNIFNY